MKLMPQELFAKLFIAVQFFNSHLKFTQSSLDVLHPITISST